METQDIIIEQIEILEKEDEELSSINVEKIELSKNALEALRLAILYSIPTFYITNEDHDDSWELIIQQQEKIVLFRQEGYVVSAKSTYYDISEEYDDDDLKDFMSQFK
jgi:hypothetical protein